MGVVNSLTQCPHSILERGETMIPKSLHLFVELNDHYFAV